MNLLPRLTRLALAQAALLGVAGSAWAQADLLPSIPMGSIAVNLDPIATGLGAPGGGGGRCDQDDGGQQPDDGCELHEDLSGAPPEKDEIAR